MNEWILSKFRIYCSLLLPLFSLLALDWLERASRNVFKFIIFLSHWHLLLQEGPPAHKQISWLLFSTLVAANVLLDEIFSEILFLYFRVQLESAILEREFLLFGLRLLLAPLDGAALCLTFLTELVILLLMLPIAIFILLVFAF